MVWWNIVNGTIEGGQLKFNKSKDKINGGIIQNSNNVLKVTSNITPDEKGNIKDVSTNGWALCLENCKNFEINSI